MRRGSKVVVLSLAGLVGSAHLLAPSGAAAQPGAVGEAGERRLELPRQETRRLLMVFTSPSATGVETGGTGWVDITLTPNPNPLGDVQFKANSAAGPQWSASVWVASFLASNLLRHSLTDFQYSATAPYPIDGPSAGALITAGMMAAIRGVPVLPTVSMTGAVNPDGTIGPVGGIPHKLLAAAQAGVTTFGYPVGQRSGEGLPGQREDLHRVAQQVGVKIQPLADVYDAYALLTGDTTLKRPEPLATTDMEVSPEQYQRLEDKTADLLARARRNRESLAWFASQGFYRQWLTPELQRVDEALGRAARESRVPVSYAQARQVADDTEVLMLSAGFLERFRRGDLEELGQELEKIRSMRQPAMEELDNLLRHPPRGAQEAVTQLSAYEGILRATAYLDHAETHLREAKTATQLPGAQLTDVLRPLLDAYQMAVMAKQWLESSIDVSELGGGPGEGVASLDPGELSRLATAYTSAAVANWAYLNALLKSLPAKERVRAQTDLRYQLAAALLTQARGRPQSENLQSALMNLAAARASYLASAQLITEEYSLQVTRDSRGQVVEAARSEAFTKMLEQAERKSLEMARLAQDATGSVPVPAQRDFQVALALREGDTEEKLKALSLFWSASLASQFAATLVTR